MKLFRNHNSPYEIVFQLNSVPLAPAKILANATVIQKVSKVTQGYYLICKMYVIMSVYVFNIILLIFILLLLLLIIMVFMLTLLWLCVTYIFLFSSVNALTPGNKSSDEILVMNTQNLLQTLLQGLQAAETACIKVL